MAKINGIAKDFGISSKDLVALLDSVGIKKNTGGTLEGEEYDLFVALLTRENQIENLEDYLSGKATLSCPRPKPEPAAKTPAPAPQKVTPPQVKTTETPKSAAKPAVPEKKPAQPEEPRYTVPKSRTPMTGDAGRGAVKNDRPSDRRGERYPARTAGGAKPAEKRKPVSQEEIARRMEQFRAEQAKRPAAPIDTSTPAAAAAEAKRAQAEKAAQQQAQAQAQAQKPAAPAKEFKPIKKKEPVDRFSRFEKKPGETAPAAKPGKTERKEERKDRILVSGGAGNGGDVVVTAEPKVRIVDTRTTQVDLSRYDDKIDSRYAGGRSDRDS